MTRGVMLLLLGTGVIACAPGFRFSSETPAPAECAAPAWCVTGLVVTEADEQPRLGAQVMVAGTPCGTLTDSAGRFTLTCTAAPGGDFIATAIGFTTLRRRVTIVPGGRYVARVPLKPVPAGPLVF